jgi:hypothetical protein
MGGQRAGRGDEGRSGGDSLWKLILVPVVLAVLIGSSSPWWWDRVFPPGPPPIPAGTTGPIPPTVPGGGAQTPGPIPATIVPGGALVDCTLTVSRPFSEIRAGPNFDETRVGDVPEGTYTATETALSEWANTDFRWFKITAAGRTGWIVDNGFMFQSKSTGCP